MSPNRTTPRVMAAATALALIAALGGGIWWFVSGDEPAAVSLDAATRNLPTSTIPTSTSAASETNGAPTSTAPAGVAPAGVDAAAGIDGVWTVDTDTGRFDFESATGTFAGFRVKEQVARIGSATAVGRTGEIDGTMTIAASQVTSAKFTIDMRSITTNESRRDDRVQTALETDRFPNAVFELTEPIELGNDAATGAPVKVDATGDLTIHGVTRSLTMPIEAKLVQGVVAVVGSTDITFADFDVKVPESQMVLSVEDHGIFELQFLLTRR